MTEENILDFESKKKKKNKSAKPEANENEEENLSLEFGSKKKKKDKPLNLKDESKENDNELDALMDELKAKKKKKKATVDELADKLNEEPFFTDKKKKKKPKPLDGDLNENADPNASQLIVKDSSGYDYDTLLTRVFNQLGDLNPELASDQKRKLVMVPPQMARLGTKKTVFVNFPTICRSLNRESSHLTTYILTELGTQGSVDGNGYLIIRGRYANKQIEVVLRNYCRNYVLCGTCQSSETELCKDSRLLFLSCRRCGSRFTVKTVTSGFQAVTGKRAALRAKTQ